MIDTGNGRPMLQVFRRDQWGKRLVVLTEGGQEFHRDKLDTDNAHERLRVLRVLMARAGTNGQDDIVHLDRQLVALAEEQDEKELAEISGGPSTLEALTTADLLVLGQKPVFLVDRILVAGELCIVGGWAKTMKTTIVLELGIKIATGLPFLGTFPTQQRRVCIVSAESGPFTLAETVKRIAKASDIDIETDLDSLLWCTRAMDLSTPAGLEALESFVTDHGVDVLILDPMYMMLPGIGSDASNLYSIGSLLRGVADLGVRLGITLVFVHHVSKSAARNRGYEPVELGDLTLAGASEVARQWLLLGRRTPFDPESGRHELWMTAGGSAGHSGCWAVDIAEGQQNSTFDGRTWETDVATASEIRRERSSDQKTDRDQLAREKLNRDVNSLIEALGEFPTGTTKGALRANVGGWSGDRINLAIASALKGGFIEACDVIPEGKKRPIEGYRLTPDTAA
jgi:hypothetical protein